MTTQTEALKLALEGYMAAYGQALEAHGIEIQQQQIEADRFAREALAEPKREPVPNLYVKDINGNFHPYKEKGHTENCAAFGDNCSENHLPPSHFGVGESDYTSQPEQEPVFWWNGGTQFATQKSKDWDKRTGGTTAFGCDIPLYTTPPQRTWVGLTDEEINNFVKAVWPREATAEDYIRAIEAKLKAKNERSEKNT